MLATQARGDEGGGTSDWVRRPPRLAASNDHGPEISDHQTGKAWGSFFWALRDILGQSTADAALVEAWITTDPGEHGKCRFTQRLLEIFPKDGGDRVDRLMAERRAPR